MAERVASMTAAELSIAARMNGMTYGKYTHLLRLGMVKLPPLSEIRAQMVVKKKRGNGAQPVCQYDMKGVYIATYATTGDAALAVGQERNRSSIICNACTGKMNSAYGYQWRYEGDKAPGVYINRGSIPVRKTQRVDKICTRCAKPYKGVPRSLYCSNECAKDAQAESKRKYLEKKKPKEEKRICKWCGKEFTAIGKRLYCTAKCQQAQNSHAQYERNKAQNRKAGA